MEVFPTVEGVEVFANDLDTITIQQESFMGNAPSLIVIPPERINDLIDALRMALKEIKGE